MEVRSRLKSLLSRIFGKYSKKSKIRLKRDIFNKDLIYSGSLRGLSCCWCVEGNSSAEEDQVWLVSIYWGFESIKLIVQVFEEYDDRFVCFIIDSSDKRFRISSEINLEKNDSTFIRKYYTLGG